MVFDHPQHAYTRKLIAVVPVADPNHVYQRQTMRVDDMPSSSVRWAMNLLPHR